MTSIIEYAENVVSDIQREYPSWDNVSLYNGAIDTVKIVNEPFTLVSVQGGQPTPGVQSETEIFENIAVLVKTVIFVSEPVKQTTNEVALWKAMDRAAALLAWSYASEFHDMQLGPAEPVGFFPIDDDVSDGRKLFYVEFDVELEIDSELSGTIPQWTLPINLITEIDAQSSGVDAGFEKTITISST